MAAAAPYRAIVGAMLSWHRPSLPWLSGPARPVAYELRSAHHPGWPVTVELLECGHLGDLHRWHPMGLDLGPRKRRCRKCARGEAPDVVRRPRRLKVADSDGAQA